MTFNTETSANNTLSSYTNSLLSFTPIDDDDDEIEDDDEVSPWDSRSSEQWGIEDRSDDKTLRVRLAASLEKRWADQRLNG